MGAEKRNRTGTMNGVFKVGAERGIVNSWNEWDPLEEIIVGIADKAVIPPREPAFEVPRPQSVFLIAELRFRRAPSSPSAQT